MSNSYSVQSAIYDGSYPASQATGANNPLVYIVGTCNGVRVWAYLFWGLIQQLNIAGGPAAIQNFLGVAFFNCFQAQSPATWLLPPQPLPIVPAASNIPLPSTGQPANTPSGSNSTPCATALVGSWSQ